LLYLDTTKQPDTDIKLTAQYHFRPSDLYSKAQIYNSPDNIPGNQPGHLHAHITIATPQSKKEGWRASLTTDASWEISDQDVYTHQGTSFLYECYEFASSPILPLFRTQLNINPEGKIVFLDYRTREYENTDLPAGGFMQHLYSLDNNTKYSETFEGHPIYIGFWPPDQSHLMLELDINPIELSRPIVIYSEESIQHAQDLEQKTLPVFDDLLSQVISSEQV